MNKNGLIILSVMVLLSCSHRPSLERGFLRPPHTALPGVLWIFNEGSMTKEAITKDLEAMQTAGIGSLLLLEVNIGIPKGPVHYFSDEWMDLFGHAVSECERLGIDIFFYVGPGWMGAGGKWIEPRHSMQHLVSTSVEVVGTGKQTITLPQPMPKKPFFGEVPFLKKQRDDFYEDVAVLAFPSGASPFGTENVYGSRNMFNNMDIKEIEEKALYYRNPYSSVPHVRAYFTFSEAQPDDQAVDKKQIIDLTDRLNPDGTLEWDVPAGRWAGSGPPQPDGGRAGRGAAGRRRGIGGPAGPAPQRRAGPQGRRRPAAQ